MNNLPLITAHSGCMNTSPNTIESIIKGIEEGADIIEVDVRATKDGVPILSHDPCICTISQEMKQVNQTTFQELTGEVDKKIVTLEEVLNIASMHNKVLNLDMKSLDALDAMVKIVEREKMVNHVILSGCAKERAMYMNKNHPQFRVLLNVEEDDLFDEKHDNLQTALEAICNDAIAMSCCGINIEYKHCNKELVDYAHKRFLPVAIWTVDDIPHMDKYLRLGVYSITTNELNALRTLKQSMKK